MQALQDVTPPVGQYTQKYTQVFLALLSDCSCCRCAAQSLTPTVHQNTKRHLASQSLVSLISLFLSPYIFLPSFNLQSATNPPAVRVDGTSIFYFSDRGAGWSVAFAVDPRCPSQFSLYRFHRELLGALQITRRFPPRPMYRLLCTYTCSIHNSTELMARFCTDSKIRRHLSTHFPHYAGYRLIR